MIEVPIPLTQLDKEIELEAEKNISEWQKENFDHLHIDEGLISLYEAAQRCGKTMAMAIGARDDYVRTKKPILSNIHYGFPWEPFYFYEFELASMDELIGRTVTIDEFNFYASHRASQTKVNQRFCTSMLQSKKKGINLKGTTHDVFYLDLMIRQNFDYLIKTTVYWIVQINGGWRAVNTRPKWLPASRHPDILKMQWLNGPQQKKLRSKIYVDFRDPKNAKYMGLYSTHNHINILAESEAYLAKEAEKKELMKEKRKATRKSPLAKAIDLGREQSFLNHGLNMQWNNQNGIKA